MGFNLKYDLENIGNIKKATISINRLTVIAGENSTGKTFVTKSLYTLLNSVYRNHFAEEFIFRYSQFERLYISFIDMLHNPASIDTNFEITFSEFHNRVKKFTETVRECSFEEQDELIQVYKKIFNDFEIELNQYFNSRLNLQKFKKYKKIINEVMLAHKEFQYTILNRVAVIIENIATHLEVGFKKNFQIINLKNLINQNQKNLKLSLSSIGDIKLDINENIEFSFDGKGIEKVQNVKNIVFFDSPVYIKIRKALQKQHRNILGSFFDRDNDKYLKGYPEHLDKLYEYIDNEYIDKPCFDEISKEIEKLISGGLKISKSGEIIYEDQEGNSIPLSLTAMGISNIGLIDLLIRNNTINEGSFLIMDEPEVHLHPKWQVALAKILYKVAEKGANVIIATHSLDLLKTFETILKEDEEKAEKIIAINKMPFDKNFIKKSELEKVQTVLDDLSQPYHDLYMQDV